MRLSLLFILGRHQYVLQIVLQQKPAGKKKCRKKKQQTKGCLSGRANHKVWACIGSGAWSRPQLAPYPPPPTSLKWGIAATDAVEQTTLCGCSGAHTSWSDNCAGESNPLHIDWQRADPRDGGDCAGPLEVRPRPGKASGLPPSVGRTASTLAGPATPPWSRRWD